jgi:hypothetical protein
MHTESVKRTEQAALVLGAALIMLAIVVPYGWAWLLGSAGLVLAFGCIMTVEARERRAQGSADERA